MKKLDELMYTLNETQKLIIGIAELPYNGKELLLDAIVSARTTFVHTVRITCWGALQETQIDVPNEFVKFFPDGKSLYDMVQEPFVFNQWCKENGIN